MDSVLRVLANPGRRLPRIDSIGIVKQEKAGYLFAPMNIMKTKLVLGTRGSDLALTQARYVRGRLLDAGAAEVEIRIITTRGDANTTLPFEKMQGQGFFTKEIEQLLLTNEIDLAVHSHKDLETTLPDGLTIAAIPHRVNRRDLLLIAPDGFATDRLLLLKPGASVGTSSVRRIAQLLFLRPDLQITTLRGNVPTRIDKLRAGEYDAIMLAAAGVERLGLSLDGLHQLELDERTFLPAPAQGALAVETRAADDQTNTIVGRIDDPTLHGEVWAEREVLRRLGGGCQLPLGVHGTVDSFGHRLSVFLGRRDGENWLTPRRVTTFGENAENAVAAAVNVLTDSNGRTGLAGKTIVLTRKLEQAGELSAQIEKESGTLICYPTLRAIAGGDPGEIVKQLTGPENPAWVLFTSGNGVEYFAKILADAGLTVEEKIKLGVIGHGTAAVCRELLGRSADFVPQVSTGEGFSAEFSKRYPQVEGPILVPTAKERGGALENQLREAGYTVHAVVVYQTVPTEQADLPEWDGRADAIIFTSPKAAQFFLNTRTLPKETKVISIGPSTTRHLVSQKIDPVYEAIDHDRTGILEVLHVLYS